MKAQLYFDPRANDSSNDPRESMYTVSTAQSTATADTFMIGGPETDSVAGFPPTTAYGSKKVEVEDIPVDELEKLPASLVKKIRKNQRKKRTKPLAGIVVLFLLLGAGAAAFYFVYLPSTEAQANEDGKCFTQCGVEVLVGEDFQDDGPNFCNDCSCEEDGKVCTDADCSQGAGVLPSCPGEPEPLFCLTACGLAVPAGTDNFQDDGTNFCNSCSCNEDGQKICSKIGCPTDTDDALCPGQEPEPTCTTTCGETVRVGVDFDDDGRNFCNSCSCEVGGVKSCTEEFCDPFNTQSLCPGEQVSCQTTCGETIQPGTNFQDDGANSCNSCSCSLTGVRQCTLIFCLDGEQCR